MRSLNTSRWRSVLLLVLAGATSCRTARREIRAEPSGSAVHIEGTPIRIAPAGKHVIDRFLASGGKVAFDDANVTHVFSPVTGRITSILAPLGTHVRRGDPLATIASPDLGTALSDLDKANADLIAAHDELKRQHTLFASHASSRRELETAVDNFRKAAAEQARAKQKAALLGSRGRSGVEQEFVLVAPIEGQVIAQGANPGIEVQGQYSGGATLELFTIGRLDPVWLMADVHEQDIGRVKLGARVDITLVAYPGEIFAGRVDWIAGVLDPDTRTVKVRCTLENSNQRLKPEMYATARIQTEGRMALAIPRAAVVHFGDKAFVYIATRDANGGLHFARRPIVADEDEPGDWVPVLHGLAAGEQVVISGALLLTQAIG